MWIKDDLTPDKLMPHKQTNKQTNKQRRTKDKDQRPTTRHHNDEQTNTSIGCTFFVHGIESRWLATSDKAGLYRPSYKRARTNVRLAPHKGMHWVCKTDVQNTSTFPGCSQTHVQPTDHAQFNTITFEFGVGQSALLHRFNL